MSHSYQQPPHSKNYDNQERMVGFEIEFTGVDMPSVASLITELYGGEIEQINAFRYSINQTSLGTFDLELDATLLKDQKYLSVLDHLGVDTDTLQINPSVEQIVKQAASYLVPYEIVTPPIPLSNIDAVDILVDELRERDAEGTDTSFLHAFGLHINPEAPSLSPADILNYLRAFILLESWIRIDADIDLSRRLTPYIATFKSDYVEHIMNPDYDPDETTLIRDYLRFGNSRNRSLDLLPLFKFMRAPLVLDYTDNELISARPAYHYRLPNCSIHDSNWSIAKEWNRWVLVEKLADDMDALKELTSAYFDTEVGISGSSKEWFSFIDKWVNNVQ